MYYLNVDVVEEPTKALELNVATQNYDQNYMINTTMLIFHMSTLQGQRSSHQVFTPKHEE